MILTLAALAALSCPEVARERDTTAVLFLAASSRGGPELARSLNAPLPEAGVLLDRIRLLDTRLADCGPEGSPDGGMPTDAGLAPKVSASRPAP